MNTKKHRKYLFLFAIGLITILALIFASPIYGRLSNASAYGSDIDNADNCLCITAEADNTNVLLYCGRNSAAPNLQKMTINETKFYDVAFSGVYDSDRRATYYSGYICKLNAGESVYVRGNNPNGFSNINEGKYNTFIIDKKFNLSGSVMSLVDMGNKTAEIPQGSHGCFANLFEEKTDGIPQTLTKVSKDFLPATSLADSCYRSMFKNCLISEAPALPAENLVKNCYMSMFFGCSSLTNPPLLSSKNLAQGCYREMFSRCNSLTNAPYLPATDLKEDCYANMFESCRNLKNIKVEFKNFDGTFCWLRDASQTANFDCPSNLEIKEMSESTVPEGWTITRH